MHYTSISNFFLVYARISFIDVFLPLPMLTGSALRELILVTSLLRHNDECSMIDNFRVEKHWGSKKNCEMFF